MLYTVSLYVLLATASLVLAGATFVLVASPADLIRDRLVAQAQARTGRDLVVKGGASLTFFPWLGVVLRDVELSTPPGLAAPAVLRAQAATARIAWRPLMEGRIAVRALVLTRPVLNLAVDADGRHNWDLAAAADRASATPIRLAQLAPRFEHGQGLPPDLYETLEKSASQRARSKPLLGGGAAKSLEEVRVTDGTIRYSDARASLKHAIAGVDLRIALDGQGAAKVSGNFAWADERVALDGELQPIEAHLTKLALRARAPTFEATWDGNIAQASPATELEGRITASAPSAAALARWLRGMPSAGPDLKGAVGLDGRLKASGSTFDLSEATITVDGATATGSVTIEAARQRPLIRANLQISKLDLDHGLALGVPAPGGEAPAPAGSIGDLLRRTPDEGLPPDTSGKVPARGSTRRAAGVWSTEPVNTSVLRLVDVAGKLDIGGLSWRGIRAGASRLNVTLDDGKLRAELEDAEFYDGRGRGVLTFHQDGSAAVIGLTASLDHVAALPLMQDVAGFDWVEGRGRLTLALATQGAHEREMVERLGGRAEFMVADGAVIGWNVKHMLRKLRQGQLSAVGRDPEMKTAFSELAGSFTLADGVAVNQDLRLTSPAVQLTGMGSIALPQRTVDYTVRPRLAIAAAAQGGTADPLSIEIPVRIQGSWAQPKFAADLQGALNDPRTAETVQQIGRQLRSGNVEEAVKGLLGGGPEAEEKAAKAKELLKRFLKQ